MLQHGLPPFLQKNCCGTILVLQLLWTWHAGVLSVCATYSQQSRKHFGCCSQIIPTTVPRSTPHPPSRYPDPPSLHLGTFLYASTVTGSVQMYDSFMRDVSPPAKIFHVWQNLCKCLIFARCMELYSGSVCRPSIACRWECRPSPIFFRIWGN